jgi:hypothetical protein
LTKDNENQKPETPLSKSDVEGHVINRFVYHYCAQYQEVTGAVAYIDGIAQLEKRITCMDDYKRIKPLIAPEHHDKLCIMSLSFIGMEQGV